MTYLRALAFAGCLVGPALADETTMTTHFIALHSDNGTVAPLYRRETKVTLDLDGTGHVAFCTGYRGHEPAPVCNVEKFQLSATALAGLTDTIMEADLTHYPIRPMQNPPVGGARRTADIQLGTNTLTIEPWPIPEDQTRADAVLDAIMAAVPVDAMTKAKNITDP